MKRLLIAALCLIPAAHSTVISGKISDLTGQIMTANRTVVFSLMNCGNNIPRVNGSSVVAPASKTILPNAAGLLTGTLIGNDILECGTVIGQTYYNVAIFAGTQKIYEKLFYISGPAWNITTAVPLSNDPTAFMNFTGYLLGDLIYGAGTNSLGLIRGNRTTSVMFLAQVGDGINSGQPFWANPMATLHTTDLSDFVTSVDGRITAQKGTANGLATLDGTGKLASPVPISVLIAGDYSGKITSGTYGISISGNAATVTNGIYTNGGPYSDPAWLTISKAKVGLSLVENTALSTWAGSGNITAIGTLVSGTVPWGRLSSVPAVSAFTNDAGYLTSASGLAWAKLTGIPSVSAFTNDAGYLTSASNVAWAKLTGIPSVSAFSNDAGYLTSASNVAWAKLTGVPAVSAFSNDAGYLTSASNLAWGKLTSVPASFPAQIMKNGTNVGSARSSLNFVEGANILLAVTDDGSKVDVQVSASGSFSATMAGDVSGATGSNVVDRVGGATAASIAAVATSGILSTGTYTDPSWLTLSKSKVGLSLVENTALSTWAGSANITAIGTLASGTVPFARLTGAAAAAHTHAIGDLSTVGDYSSKITSGTYSIAISGNAASASAVPWSGISSLPAFASNAASGRVRISDLGCAASYLTSCDANVDGVLDNAAYATSAGNATTAGGLAVGAVANNVANHIVRTDDNGYIQAGWINTVSGDNGTTAITRVYASNDAYLRFYTLANFAKQSENAVQHEASFVWQDNYIALPTGTSFVQWGVFAAEASQNTITKVQCWSDTNDAYLQLRRNDGGDMMGNLLCNGASTTSFNGYNVIPAGWYVGMYEVSGSAKRINVAITYTTSY